MFSLKHKIRFFIALVLFLSSWFELRFAINLKIMKLFTLPNLLTLGNLFCGILSCIFILYDFVPLHYLLITFSLSLIFDFLDGMIARLLRQNSEIGIQLDSLADMVSFGMVPGLAAFSLLFAVNDSTFNNTFIGSFFPSKNVHSEFSSIIYFNGT